MLSRHYKVSGTYHGTIGREDKMGVFSDKYYANEKSIRAVDPNQDAIEPVDVEGGYVGEKGDPDIIAKTQENIQCRFTLDPRE